MPIVYIALGSNLGDRLKHLQNALDELARIPSLQCLRLSPLYETAPVGMPKGTPWFLNAVVEVAAECSPHRLLEHTAAVEQNLGRIRPEGGKKTSRIIDLDILLFGDYLINDPELQIPHPRMCEREFVLRPLADLRPTLHVPGCRETVMELLNAAMKISKPGAVRRMDSQINCWEGISG